MGTTAFFDSTQLLPLVRKMMVMASRLAVTVPGEGEGPITARLLFVDRLEAIRNSIHVGPLTICPAFRECSFTVRGRVFPRFRRGDCDGDGQVSGVVTDAVYLLTFNFLGGPAPPEPFPDCGRGTPDDEALGCETQPEGCAPAG